MNTSVKTILSLSVAIVFVTVLMIFAPVFYNVSASEKCKQTQSESVCLPCIMYHSVLKSRQGKYIVSPTQLENDLSALKQRGFTAVTSQQLIDFVDGNGTLPPKPILITFDDGHYNNLFYAEPLLAKYDMHAVINIIGRFTEYSSASGDSDNPNYSHVTWQEVGQLAARGVFEIGNHTYNIHNYSPRFGASRCNNESDEQYAAALTADVGKVQKCIFLQTQQHCAVFAYPFGKYSKLSEATLRGMGFRITLTCNEGVSVVTANRPETLYLIKRVNRSGLYDTATLLRKLGCE